MTVEKDIPVDYNDAQHAYSYAGQRYISASQIVEKFTQPFNSLEVATRYAEKNGFTAEYWMDVWEKNKQDSLVRGNFIHDAQETSLHGRMIDIFGGKQVNVIGDSVVETDPWILRPDGVYTERKLWHHGYKIAGRSDKIILSTENFVRYAHVEDYKSNKKLDKESYQFKNGSYKMMKPPLGHLMDCNFNHYQLQLSLYMFMLEYQGFKPGTIRIIHIPHEGGRQVHECQYLKREVVNIMRYL